VALRWRAPLVGHRDLEVIAGPPLLARRRPGRSAAPTLLSKLIMPPSNSRLNFAPQLVEMIEQLPAIALPQLAGGIARCV
jgi:hypothetical protein